MIEFSKNVKKILPYDRDKYISKEQWYGVSFQLPSVSQGQDIGLQLYVKNYKYWFENIINQLDNNSTWIVNHETFDKAWFPNNDKNLIALRTLFKQNSIPNTFKGALVFATNDLLKFTTDIISYPYTVCREQQQGRFYSNIDISNSHIPFVIKILDHLNIDLLSTDLELLKKVVNDNSSDIFIERLYRGTPNWH